MLIAHWTFDVSDIDGRRVTDSSGGGLTAELDEHAEIVPGRDGEVLAFDGHGRATVAAAPQLVLSQIFGFSLAFFVKATGGPSGEWRGLVHKPVAIEHDARAIGLWLYPDAMRVRAQLFTVKGPEYIDSRAQLRLDEWAHVAFVVDTDGMFLYINGKLDVAEPLEHAVVTPAGPIHLGSEPGRAGLTGELDDFRVYSSALDAEAVRALAEP
jgi:hypothetical protein